MIKIGKKDSKSRKNSKGGIQTMPASANHDSCIKSSGQFYQGKHEVAMFTEIRV